MWKVEEKVFDMEVLLSSKEQECNEVYNRLEQLIQRHSLEINEKDR